MFHVGGMPMRKHLALLIILLLTGCYTTMPVHTMSDSQLQHEYLEKSSELTSEELQLQILLHTMSDSKLQHEYLEKNSELTSEEPQLQIQRQSKDFQEGMASSLIYTMSELRERLTALRIELTRRGLYTP
jgi:hypothetical protein